MNGKQLEDLLKIWDLVIPGAFPQSKYLFNKSISNTFSYNIFYFCDVCDSVIKPEWEKCKVCLEKILQEEGKSENYFVTFPIQEQVRHVAELQSANLLKKSELIQSANYQRWSRGHKARGQGQGQGHKKNPRPRPRPRTAFSRTEPLEAKDRNARGQGQGPRTQAQVFSEKKVFKNFFQAISNSLAYPEFLIGGGLNHKSHAMTSSKFFQRGSFCLTKIS